MSPEDSIFVGKIVDQVSVTMALMPDANTVALCPADFERVQEALSPGPPQILVDVKISQAVA